MVKYFHAHLRYKKFLDGDGRVGCPPAAPPADPQMSGCSAEFDVPDRRVRERCKTIFIKSNG